jgi:hypothetical protein
MLWHDLRLALRSIRHSPYISALIVAVIAVGIATSVTAITLYHAKAGNPIWWKNAVLYRVMLDSRPESHERDNPQHPEYPPFTLIYRDALAIYRSKIPEQSVMELYSDGLVDSLRAGERPFHRRIRVTTHEFFSMFDVPFLYGHAWSKSDDEGPLQVVVISRNNAHKLRVNRVPPFVLALGFASPDIGRQQSRRSRGQLGALLQSERLAQSWRGHEHRIYGRTDVELARPRQRTNQHGFKAGVLH